MIGVSITHDRHDETDAYTVRTASINDLGEIALRSLTTTHSENLNDALHSALDAVAGYQGTCAIGLPDSLLRLDERTIPARLASNEQKRAAMTFSESYFGSDGLTMSRTLQRTIAGTTTHSLYLAAMAQNTLTTIQKAMKHGRRLTDDIIPNAFALAKATGIRERTIVDLTDITDTCQIYLYTIAPPTASQRSWVFAGSRIGKDELDTLDQAINDAVFQRVISPPTSIDIIDPHGVFPQAQRLAGAPCRDLPTRLNANNLPYIIAIGLARGEVTTA